MTTPVLASHYLLFTSLCSTHFAYLLGIRRPYLDVQKMRVGQHLPPPPLPSPPHFALHSNPPHTLLILAAIADLPRLPRCLTTPFYRLTRNEKCVVRMSLSRKRRSNCTRSCGLACGKKCLANKPLCGPSHVHPQVCGDSVFLRLVMHVMPQIAQPIDQSVSQLIACWRLLVCVARKRLSNSSSNRCRRQNVAFITHKNNLP